MSDERVRAARRRWELAGEPTAEAHFLREQLRAGDLDPSRLELAAHCAHPAACQALRAEPPEVAVIEQWGDSLGRWGRETCVRALIAAARGVLPRWLDLLTRADQALLLAGQSWPRRAIELAESWIVSPTGDLAEEAWALATGHLWGLDQEVVRFATATGAPAEVRASASSASHALTTCAYAARFTNAGREPSLEMGGVLVIAAGALGYDSPDEAAIRRAIAEELVPWALGRYDPVERRVRW